MSPIIDSVDKEPMEAMLSTAMSIGRSSDKPQ